MGKDAIELMNREKLIGEEYRCECGARINIAPMAKVTTDELVAYVSKNDLMMFLEEVAKRE